MKLVIEIPDHIYEHAKNRSEDSYDEWDAMRAIAKGVPYEPRPHGEWKSFIDGMGIRLHRCSECERVSFEKSFFCPNCGADMRKEGEEE